MKIFCCIILMVCTLINATGQTEFKEPWKDEAKAIVLDPFYRNRIDWAALSTESRVAGIIHKASEGLRSDSEYTERKREAKKRGYLWGSYHLGRPGNPIQQADFYLEKAQPSEDEVMALDLEDIGPAFMSIDNARRFIIRIKEKAGRYPMIYVTGKIRDAILRNYGSKSVFAKTPLWYARYRANFDITRYFPTKLWSTYTLWQFASEINCPSKRKLPCALTKPIPGTDYNMDVNIFYGSVDELKKKWPFTVK